MKIMTDSFSFLLQVLAVAFVAGIGWNLAGGLAIAISEHISQRLLAARLRRQANETLETMKRASDIPQVVPIQEACCATYAMSGGMEHGDRCVWKNKAFAAKVMN